MKRSRVCIAGIVLGLSLALLNPDSSAPTTSTVPLRYCPGSNIPIDKAWDFSEPAGSTVFKETYTHATADNLTITSFGGVPTANGAYVTFHDNSILRSAGNVFNPENRDFVYCISYAVNDSNGYNLTQIDNSKVPPTVAGFLKLTGWYAEFNTTDRRWKCDTGVRGTIQNGTGWHSVTMERKGNVFNVYMDGKTANLSDPLLVHKCPITENNIGPIHMTKPISVGGKLENSGAPTEIGDLFNGSVAYMMVGMI